VLPRDYLEAALALAARRGLASHLDGARIVNAAVKLGLEARALCRGFDSVSVCLSKGLGAPAGTLLLGSEAFIARARRARKILGGAMRQAGVIAAAGLYALERNVERLAEDHDNAERLAAGLSGIAGLEVEPPQTNMVFARIAHERAAALADHLRREGVLVLPGARLRLVTHLDVDRNGIERAAQAVRRFFGGPYARD
jgi:threonine aldolase